MKKRRMDTSINAGSMADIAFLLLIFFLVTTTIVTDKGIMIKLPPIYEGPIPPIPARNVINIKLNANGELWFEKNTILVENLKVQVKSYILNKENLPDRPRSPAKAVISFQNDRGTFYKDYLEVYDQLKGAYRELWDEEAQSRFNTAYVDLEAEEQKTIRRIIPQIISEAEPTDLEANPHSR